MLRGFFQKLFIAIVKDNDSFNIKIVIEKKSKVIKTIKEHFGGEKARENAISYIRRIIDDSPLYYVATLNISTKQGVIAGCDKKDLPIAFRDSCTVCRDKKYTIYADPSDVSSLQKFYAPLGLDALFSPYSMIENIYGDKIDNNLSLYLILLNEVLVFGLYEGGVLEFTKILPMDRDYNSTSGFESEDSFSLGIQEEREKPIDLAEIDTFDDLEILDDLGDLDSLEDLESLEEIEEFVEDEPIAIEKSVSSDTLDNFNDDFIRFELIKDSLDEFYSSSVCNSRFVESVYIADCGDCIGNLKQLIEDELFISVISRKIEAVDVVCELLMSENMS